MLKWLVRLFIVMMLGAVLGVASLIGIYFYIKPQLPDVSALRDVKLATPMKVYSRDGELISQFGEIRRIPLRLDEIPQPMIDAVLATEDARFYEHPGIDPHRHHPGRHRLGRLRPGPPGRQYHHPAGCAQLLPEQREDPSAQDKGSVPGLAHRAESLQG